MPRETKQQAGRGMGRRMHALGVLVVLPTALSGETGTDLPTYKIGCATMDRFACNAACTDAGWTMLCIQNAQQNNFIWNSVTKTGVDTWLGYSDKEIEGTWEWVNGCQSNYTNWAGYEPNNYGGNEDCAVLSPTYYSSVKGWNDASCEYSDQYLCVCQTDEANPADFVFPQKQNCNNAKAWGHGLGISGWAHWLTFHARCNGLQALHKNNGYGWTRGRAILLHLTLVLSILMTAGGSLLVDKCTCNGSDRDLGITYTVFGVWGFLWTLLALIHLRGKGIQEEGNNPLAPIAPMEEPEHRTEEFRLELAPVAAELCTEEGPTSGLSLVAQLSQLKEAKEGGLISEEEAAQSRARILAKYTS